MDKPQILNPDQVMPGNFILVNMNSWLGRAITVGQKLKYGEHPYVQWNHVALITSEKGDLIEAHAKGIKRNTIAEYLNKGRYVQTVSIEASDEDRKQMVAFAEHCLTETYGFVTIMCIFFALLSGGKMRFHLKGTEICSGLVARALERGNYIFDDDPATIMPADLASKFNVTHG